MEAMLTTMQSVLTFSMSIFETVVGNPIMSFILAGSLVGIGITVLRQVKMSQAHDSEGNYFPFLCPVNYIRKEM